MSTVTYNARSPDPTQSLTLRRNFARDFRSRWRTFRSENRQWIENSIDDDATSEILTSYRRWVDQTTGAIVLETANLGNVKRGQHWTGTYVRQAYQKGLRIAKQNLKRAGYDDESVEFATTQRLSEHRETLRREYLTAYYDAEDATATVRKFLTRVLSDGLRDGDSASTIASDMSSESKSRGDNATNALVNTVVVETVNEASLTAFGLAGVERLGVEVEVPGDAGVRSNAIDRFRVNEAGEIAWETAMDSRVCDDCLALEGRIMKIGDVQDSPQFRPPIHANCRCLLVPMPPED